MRTVLLLAVAPVAAQIPVELLHDIPSPGDPEGAFGVVLAPFPDADSDGTPDFLAGAYFERVAGQDGVGRAYLVSGATGAILRAFEPPVNFESHFGAALAHAGDLNADGVADVLAGANLYPGPGEENFEGRVFMLSGATGDVLNIVRATDDEGRFGAAVVATDDLDGDGTPDVLASKPDGLPTIVVASGATGEVLREFRVEGDITGAGRSLAVVDDLTGDGVREVAVGTPNGPRGQVFVVDPATGALVYAIANPTGTPTQQFGDRHTLAALDDLDGDAVTDLAVGAPNALRPDGLYGYVHLFSGADGALLRTCDEPAGLGVAVAAVGDLNGDGVPDVLTRGAISPSSVVALSGATCDVLVTIPTPLVEPMGFPTAITTIREAEGGEALVAVGAFGSLPGEAERSYRVFVYRVGGTVAASPSPEASGLSVSVSPVPSSGAASLSLSVPPAFAGAGSAGAVRVSVVDALGRTVATVHVGLLTAGTHALAVDVSRWPAGVYAVRVQAGDASATARAVVAR